MRIAYRILNSFLTGVSLLALISSAQAQPGPVVKQLDMPYRGVEILGPVNVQIEQLQVPRRAQIIADKQTFNTVQMAERNGMIFIGKTTWPTPCATKAPSIRLCLPCLYQLNIGRNSIVTATYLTGPLSVVARDNATLNLSGDNLNLKDLNVYGPATVNISGVYSPGLNLYHDGSGKINLQGMANLRNFTQIGTGQTVFCGVNGKHATINMIGQNQLTIAGQTCVLEANLSRCATLDAKNLHALRGYIHTCGNSHAEVWVKNSLTAWAAGSSNIYYYTDPRFVAQYMCPPAAVIRMTGICSCACR